LNERGYVEGRNACRDNDGNATLDEIGRQSR
jgi:hypothetical protein